jgi:predicted outer membrane repeat protein
LGAGLWNDGPSVWTFNAPAPSTLSILAGAVTGNTATTDGGGVYGTLNGVACQKGATISGNNPDDFGGTVGVCP